MSSTKPTESEKIEDPDVVSEADHLETRPEEAELEGSDANLSTSSDLPVWRLRLSRATGRVRRVAVEVWVLWFLAGLTRFANLFSPHSIVFDETYFRQYALEYQSHTYYFDLHPPLGKMLLGLWAWISGASGTAANKDPAVVIRILPAFCGTVLIIVIYYFIRRLSGSRRIATLGAGMMLLDTALLTESRFTLMDSMLLLSGMSAVTLALRARTQTGRAYWWTFAAAALAAGFCMSIKVTGLTAIGLVGVIWLADVLPEYKTWKTTWRRRIPQMVMLGLIPIAVYLSAMAIHFALLPKSGIGDGYMTNSFQATLKGNPNYNPNAHLSFFTKFKDLNKAMTFYEHALDGSTHPNASKWYTWPITKRSVYLYYGQANDGKSRYIYEIGNPAVWWGTILGAAIVFIGMIARPKKFAKYKWALGFLALAWAANFFPFAFITRPMFIYHYFFGLIFSLTFVAIGLGALTGAIDHEPSKPFAFRTRWTAAAFWTPLGVALALFLYFGPIVYGLPISGQGLTDRLWLSTWR